MKKQKRIIKFQMCMTEEEKALATQIADRFGLSISEFIRRTCFQKKLPKQVTKISAKTYFELHKIGVNLNQLAKVANTAMQFEKENAIEYRQISSELRRLEQLIDRVCREIISSNVH